MKIILKTLFLLILSTTSYTQEQIIEAAPVDKSVVYFMRPSISGIVINFTYYDDSKIIAKFDGRRYFRYECDPGERTFWAKSENRSYLKANLKAGKIYVVEAISLMGAFKAGVKLEPITARIHEMKRFQRLLKNVQGERFTDTQIERWNQLLVDSATKRGLERLRELEEKNYKFVYLPADYYVQPADLMFPKKKKKRKMKSNEDQ